VHAASVNECPEPTTFTRPGADATAWAISSVPAGRTIEAGEQV
jgi:hypothetical protein